MVVQSVRVNMLNSQHVVILKEVGRERYLPIWIGPWEADAIARKLQDLSPERPLTHDLFAATLVRIGAVLQKVIISEITDETYKANLQIEIDGRAHEVDARPSDAIALALRTGAPIYATHDVLTRSRSIEIAEDLGEAEQWRQWIDRITPGDFASNPPGGAAPGTDD